MQVLEDVFCTDGTCPAVYEHLVELGDLQGSAYRCQNSAVLSASIVPLVPLKTT